MNTFNQRLAIIILIIILIIAAGLRFYNLSWDDRTFAHPDERSTVAFYAPTIKWPSEDGTLLDPRQSTLNPFWDVGNQNRRSYTYGHFPLYTLVLAGNFLQYLVPIATSLGFSQDTIDFLSSSLSGHGFAIIGRWLMALADLGIVFLLFLLGRRLYGLWGGVLAAALSTFTVLQIQLAHFFAVDTVSTTFTILAIYGSVLLYDKKSIGAALLTGVGIGLAVASKFSALPVVSAPVIAGILVIFHARYKGNLTTASTTPNQSSHAQLIPQMVGLVILTGLISFLTFALTSPFVLLDFENFRQAVVEEQGNMVSGAADFPFTRQYRGTTPYLYFIEQQLRWGMGWPLGLLALAGTLWVIAKTLRGKAHPGELIALAWIVLYFGPTGLFLAKFMRYMVMVVPLTTLFGAGLIIAIWNIGVRQNSQNISDDQTTEPKPTFFSVAAKPLAIILSVITLVGASVWSFAFVNGVYGTEHSWVTFSRWVYENVPEGSCIAREHWEEGVPVGIEGLEGKHPSIYRQPEMPMYNEDTKEKYDYIRTTLKDCDYIVLASNRLWRTIPKLPERYPMSVHYYEALFSGELGYEQIYTVETPPKIAGFVFDDQAADESFTVYDHPKPILFKKVRQLSDAEWDALLGNLWQEAVPYYVGDDTLLMRLRGQGRDNHQAVEVEEGKSLLLDTPVDELTPINDFRWNQAANQSTFLAVIIWGLLILVVGWLAFPLTFLLFHKLADRGYTLSKSLGLLLVAYFIWINSSVGGLANTATTGFIGLIILLLLGLWVGFQQRKNIAQFLRQNALVIILAEGVFVGTYLFFIYLRTLNPDLWQPWLGGEKMLEIGFLNAIVKSATMPPYDPFFAGGIINYYYYGLFLAGTLIKLTGIQPSIGFNLAVSTLAALTATNVFSLAGNLALTRSPFRHLPPTANQEKVSPRWETQSISAGLLGVLFVVFIGNLEGAFQFLRMLGQFSLSEFRSAIPGLEVFVRAFSGLLQVLGDNAVVGTYNYWDPTRVIPQTINEFPYFSFLFADLHPHMIGIPFTVLFLSLAYNWLSPDNRSSQPSVTMTTPNTAGFIYPLPSSLDQIKYSLPALLRWLALPFVLGAISLINTWDLPTYLGLMLAAFLISQYRKLPDTFSMADGINLIIRGGIFVIVLVAMTYLLYLPFFNNYQAPAETGLGFVSDKTPIDQHLKIWGYFLFLVVSWLLISLSYPSTRNSFLRAISLGLRRWNVIPHLSQIFEKSVTQRSEFSIFVLWGAVFIAGITLALLFLGYTVPAYLLPLVSIALLLLFRKDSPSDLVYLALLAFTSLLILLGVEFVFLRDFLGGGDFYRMNTLFKFYTQVWVMFGIMSAVALAQMWSYRPQANFLRQLTWQLAVLILLLGTLIYPILGTRTRVDDRFPGDDNRPAIGTLDGLAYMQVGVFEWPAGSPIELKYDYDAIQWLQDNVIGTPIIAEAKIGYYREGGMRVAAYTGLPSVLGGLHQGEQRYASQIGARDQVVNEFWTTLDSERTRQLIQQLDITYIYVGQIERITYGDHVQDKFDQLQQQGMLEITYQNNKTIIYKVVPAS